MHSLIAILGKMIYQYSIKILLIGPLSRYLDRQYIGMDYQYTYVHIVPVLLQGVHLP